MRVRMFGSQVHFGLGTLFLLYLFFIWGFSSISDVYLSGVFSVIALLCLLTHEFAHVFAGRRFGIECPNITVFFFGMGAHLQSTGKTPKQAFWIAVAGPIASFLLAGSFFLVGGFMPNLLIPIASLLVVFNIVLALFNLLPLFPTDGGRIAHSFFWRIKGDRIEGMRLAVRLGKTSILLLMSFLVYLVLFNGRPAFSLIWPALIGWLLWSASSAELKQSEEST